MTSQAEIDRNIALTVKRINVSVLRDRLAIIRFRKCELERRADAAREKLLGRPPAKGEEA